MQANRYCLPAFVLFLSGCAMPLGVLRFASPGLTSADVVVGERYVFEMEPDQSGAGFRYRGKVDRVDDSQLILTDATVEARLDRGSSILQRWFGEPTTVSREADREMVVELDRIATVSSDVELGEPSPEG